MVLLTLSTTMPCAGDLGFLLHKHPDRAQAFEVAVGTAHVVWPEATDLRGTVALVLEVATGTHLPRTGQLEASLPALLDLAPAWTPDALAAKAVDERLTVERAGLPGLERLQADVERMTQVLEQARQDSILPDEASVEPALHDLVLRFRRS